jgi:hypothetical protein
MMNGIVVYVHRLTAHVHRFACPRSRYEFSSETTFKEALQWTAECQTRLDGPLHPICIHAVGREGTSFALHLLVCSAGPDA